MLKAASPMVQQLVALVERSAAPLDLAATVAPMLDQIKVNIVYL